MFNVSGIIYETKENTLKCFPETLLGNPERRQEYFNKERNEYFFNRGHKSFEAILFFYQSFGKLYRPYNVHYSVCYRM